MSVLGDFKIPIPCPKCKHEIKETIARLKTQPAITCSSCVATFNVKDKNFRSEIDRAEAACCRLRAKTFLVTVSLVASWVWFRWSTVRLCRVLDRPS